MEKLANEYRPFECKGCHKMFYECQFNGFNEHAKLVQNPKYVCPDCGKICVRLKKHAFEFSLRTIDRLDGTIQVYSYSYGRPHDEEIFDLSIEKILQLKKEYK